MRGKSGFKGGWQDDGLMVGERRNPALRFERETRAASWVIYAACVAYALWLGATRWHGVPADPGGGFVPLAEALPPPGPGEDRTQELAAALAGMPTLPPLSFPPAPKGMRWVSNRQVSAWAPDEVCYDPWAPEEYPYQFTAIQFFETPGVNEAMDVLVGLRAGRISSTFIAPGGLRASARLLIARARYRSDQLGDIDAAIHDLRAVLTLAQLAYHGRDSILWLTGMAIERLGLAHIRLLATEQSLGLTRARDCVDFIDGTPPSGEYSWRLLKAAEFARPEGLLASSFTSSDAGGWLVLSDLGSVVDGEFVIKSRHAVWNVFSILFNDRRSIQHKLDELRVYVDRAFYMAYGEKSERLRQPPNTCDFNVLDGPLVESDIRRDILKMSQIVTQLVADRRATIMALALSSYRDDHGEYPPALVELPGEYLESLPVDPFVDQPFHYARNDDGTYLLYSVGPNCADDGGKERQRGEGADAKEYDVVYSNARDASYREFKLEKVEP